MQQRLSRYTVSRWAGDFLDCLKEVKRVQQGLSVRKLSQAAAKHLLCDYAQARTRLILLDYDGTLRSFVPRPELARPDSELLDLLRELANDPKNELVIISGRQKDTLRQWLGKLNAILVAEHGGWTRRKGGKWRSIEPLRTDWKDAVRPILELYVDRTPGSFVEEKDFSLVWHCRRAEPEQARVRSQELRGALLGLTENLNLGVFEGSEIIEVKTLGVSKGRTTNFLLEQKKWDFILAAGDDYTDEDMFAVLPEKAYSIRVGPSLSKARFNVDSVQQVRTLISELLRS